MGQNFKLFNGLIHKPVLIFKAAFGVSGFSGIIDAGVKIYTDLAVGICGNGSHLLGTFFIGVNGDLPAFKGLAGVGRLMEPAQSLLTVMPCIFCGLACNDRDGVVSQLAVPVVVTVGKLQNGIAAGLEFAGAGIPRFVGGIVAHDIPVRILNAERPAAELIASVRRLTENQNAKLFVGVFDFGLCTGSNCNLLFDNSIVSPVCFISVVNLNDVIRAGFELTGCCIAVLTGCNGFYQLPVCIQNLEIPSFGASVNGILFYAKIAIVGIAEGHRYRRIRFDGDGLDRRITDPVGIIHRNFLCIQLLGRQAIYHNGAVFACCKGGTFDWLRAGDIRIDPNLPAGEVLSCIGLLDQSDGTGFQRVMEADRGGGTVGNRHLLGVVACTAVHCLNIIVTVSKLLDIVGADFQTGNGDGTLGIRCMGAGHQCGATGIGVDSKFPACQIQPVAGRFGQTEVSGFDLIDEGNRGCCTPGDGYFLRIGAGTHILLVYRGIRVADFFHIVGTRGDAVDRNAAVGIRCMRAGNQSRAAGIGINAKSPAGKIRPVIRFLCQSQPAGIELVHEADRCRAAVDNRNLLRICAGAYVQALNTGIGMPQFFDIIGASGKTGNADPAAGICRVRAGNEAGAGGVGIDPKLPSG